MTQSSKELALELQKATEKVKGLGEELKGRMSLGEQKLDNIKGDVDAVLQSINEVTTRLADVEQKQARRSSASVPDQPLGRKLFESESFKQFAQNPVKGNRASL